MSEAQHMQTDMRTILDRQKQAFLAELPVSREVRLDRLTRAIDLLVDHKDALIDAIRQDYGQRTEEVTLVADLVPSVQALKHARKNVKKWMKAERRSPTFPLGVLGTKATVEYRPKGVVGIIGPWNFPLNLIFAPLAGALAAGNRVMIKPSEHVPVTSALIQRLIALYFQPEEVAVFTGGIDVSERFVKLPLDHIFYTGSGAVGRLVMKAAAENLTPVTLELGGKSPTIILPDQDIPQAAQVIASAKMANAGQICVAPDYVFVPRTKVADLTLSLLAAADKFYPEGGEVAYTEIINAQQKQRLERYIADAKAKGATVATPESYGGPRQDNILPLHIVTGADDSMMVMQEEIFGPILPLLPYDHIDEVIDYITARPRPLATYMMGRGVEGKTVQDKVLSGGMAYGEFLLHVGQEDLPFGGTGGSGMGNYHGIDGFRTFSHAMAVFKRGPFDILGLLQGRPPFGGRFKAYIKQELRK